MYPLMIGIVIPLSSFCHFLHDHRFIINLVFISLGIDRFEEICKFSMIHLNISVEITFQLR